MEFGTICVDIVMRMPDELEQIGWKPANEVHKLVLTGFSVAPTVGWLSMFEESA